MSEPDEPKGHTERGPGTATGRSRYGLQSTNLAKLVFSCV